MTETVCLLTRTFGERVKEVIVAIWYENCSIRIYFVFFFLVILTTTHADNMSSTSRSVEDLGLLAQIVCPRGRCGLVSTNYIRSPRGLRIHWFWKMTNFLQQTDLVESYRHRMSLTKSCCNLFKCLFFRGLQRFCILESSKSVCLALSLRRSEVKIIAVTIKSQSQTTAECGQCSYWALTAFC